MSDEIHTRRGFLLALPFGAAALIKRANASLPSDPLAGVLWCLPRHGDSSWSGTPLEHPEPRPGVDASKVLSSTALGNPAVAPIFDMMREIPEIADGILCYCGCADIPGYYSLLTCYEAPGMAQWCEICQGQAKLVYRRHKEGQSLDRIRNAVDARFG